MAMTIKELKNILSKYDDEANVFVSVWIDRNNGDPESTDLSSQENIMLEEKDIFVEKYKKYLPKSSTGAVYIRAHEMRERATW